MVSGFQHNMENQTAQQNETLANVNNNPGDLRFIGQSGASQGKSGFASFQSPKEGFGALLNDVQSKINRNPTHTLADFANTYAPPSDGNNSAQYAANLANKLGVPPNTPLSALQPKIGQFAEAIGGNEGFKDVNSKPNPTPQEVNESDPNAPMSTFEKLALGIPIVGGTIAAGFLTGGAADAAVPEEIAALGGEEALAGGNSAIGGLLSKVGGYAKNLIPAGLVEAGDTVKNIISGNKQATATTSAGDENANATLGAGAEAAQATQQASQADMQEKETLADEAQTEKQIQDAKSAGAAINQSLGQTASGRVLQQLPETQQTTQYMAHHGYVPDTSSGFDNYSVANQKAEGHLEELSNGVGKVLKEEGSKGNLTDVITAGDANIDKFVPTHERESAKKYLRELAQHYNSGGTGTVSLESMEHGKREQYKAVGKWDATRPSAHTAAHRALAKGFRDTIEKGTKHKDLYNRVMKEEQKIFAAKKVMKHRNGKKSLEHKGLYRGILKSYGKYVGTYLGDKIGGPLGAVIGTMVGDHLTKAVDKRFGKTYFESKEGKKLIELASKKSPTIAKTLKKELHKYGVKAEEMKKEVEHQKIVSEKRKLYKEKKTSTEKSSEYEPYQKEGIIKMGKKPKKKSEDIPTIEF